MNTQADFLLFVAALTVLLMPAKKWAEMNPNRIEGGPLWRMAALDALWTMALFVLAMGLFDQGYSKTGAFFGSSAFGSAIGGCFSTEFKPNSQQVPSLPLRWLTGKLSVLAVCSFKSIVVVPAGWLISKVFTSINGLF